MPGFFGCGRNRKHRLDDDDDRDEALVAPASKAIKSSRKALRSMSLQQRFINAAGETFFIPSTTVAAVDLFNSQGSLSIPRPWLLTIKLCSAPALTLFSGSIRLGVEECCCREKPANSERDLNQQVRTYLVRRRAVQYSFAAWALSVLIEAVPSLVELGGTKPLYSQAADATLAIVEFFAWMCLERCLSTLVVSNEEVANYIAKYYPGHHASSDTETGQHCPSCGEALPPSYRPPGPAPTSE